MVRTDAQLGEKIFQYYYNGGRFGGADEETARIEWNRNLMNNSAEFRAFAVSYLPVYAQPQTFNIGNFTLDERLRAPLAAAGVTAAGGLAAILIGSGMDGGAKYFVQSAGEAGLYFSPAVGFGTHFYGQLNDTGRLWLRRAGAVGYCSLMALVLSGGIYNDAASSVMGLAGKAGVAASGIGALVTVVRHRN